MVRITKMLLLVCGLYLALQVVGAVVSVIYGLPGEFVLPGEDPGDPNEVLSDVLRGQGAALVAPIAPLIALIVFMLLARGRRWWGTLGVVGICALALLFTNGAFGEPLTWETLRYPASNLIVTAMVALFIVVPLLMLLLGVLNLIGRARTRKQAAVKG